MSPKESVFIILGNQLFPTNILKKLKVSNVFMAEDSGLCTHYKYHKHKIIFFLSAMRRYRDELKKMTNITYIDASCPSFTLSYEQKLSRYLEENKKIKRIECFEIEDKFFENRIKKFSAKRKVDLIIHPSPMFLVSREDFSTYLEGTKKPFMKTFYELQRKKFNILIDKDGKPTGGKWSYDEANRKKMPKDISPPEVPQVKVEQTVSEVIDFVEKEFSHHPGDSKNFWLPTTRKESLKWLRHFIKHKLEKFGTYQDSMTDKSDFVFHSVISPMVNAGLLLPSEIVNEVQKYYELNKKTIPLNSIEGFIRQILGWREFVRGIYQNFEKEQWNTNFWNHQNKMKRCWYTAETGLEILDDSINKALKYSYNHHIERLMILSNIMLLCEIHPHQVYRWFMEMYSDSSDWVMAPNVFGMGQFSDGGIFATKPYICGSNYYRKMGHYKKGEWCDIVDGLYWRFIDKHKEIFSKNPRMSMMVRMLEKIDSNRRQNIFNQANVFIEKVTTLN